MWRILELVESDETLSFFINEIDNWLGYKLNLLDGENIDHYKNQKIQLEEFIGVKIKQEIPNCFNLEDYVKDKIEISFICKRNINGDFVTVAHTDKQDIPLIVWSSNCFSYHEYTPQQRCVEVSKRFQELHSQKKLKYLTTKTVNNSTILCFTMEILSEQTQHDLDDLENLSLLTLNPSRNPNQILRELIAINDDRSKVYQEYDSEGRLYINIEHFLLIINSQISQIHLRESHL